MKVLSTKASHVAERVLTLRGVAKQGSVEFVVAAIHGSHDRKLRAKQISAVRKFFSKHGGGGLLGTGTLLHAPGGEQATRRKR